MKTRPSRKAPSSLLSATKASSACTRSSSRLKARTSDADDGIKNPPTSGDSVTGGVEVETFTSPEVVANPAKISEMDPIAVTTPAPAIGAGSAPNTDKTVDVPPSPSSDKHKSGTSATDSNSGSNTTSNGVDLSYSDAAIKMSFQRPSLTPLGKTRHADAAGIAPFKQHLSLIHI